MATIIQKYRSIYSGNHFPSSKLAHPNAPTTAHNRLAAIRESRVKTHAKAAK